ncbi:MvaI/BcnI family restriction endonuclease [Limimaricola soesokkakensis]|uniref:MvaI/BcnI family restriction endonuclease n=1 Tax=Limimaricola soesokkakensis TaxID=1343159 RepID=UPI0013FD36F2|nr:MvaI/BcnI family restriction endonuclease [Limimaricola soesokkakensis]
MTREFRAVFIFHSRNIITEGSMRHEATDIEKELIDELNNKIRGEFCLIRVTQTMLEKCIIDANRNFSRILKAGGFFDYSEAADGEISSKNVEILAESGWTTRETSFYRPKAKPEKAGDPRFWPSRFGELVEQEELIYITVVRHSLFIIPLRKGLVYSREVQERFDAEHQVEIRIGEVVSKLKELQGKWVKSCSPLTANAKDVGDTLEAQFNLPINNLGTADYHGVELKAKRKKSKTADTLFSQVPNPKISPKMTARDIILAYGYESTHPKREGYKDLFVTVSAKPNPQGLYLSVNYNEETVDLKCTGRPELGPDGHLVAAWDFDLLESRLSEKHPTTAWIIADEKVISNEIHFKFETLEVSQKPVFSQFLFLIERGLIAFDWRGGYHPTDSGRVDKGHAFRLKSARNRCLLFGDLRPIDLTS